jgi:hypothetical protein
MNDTAFVLLVGEDDGTQGEAFCDALREVGVSPVSLVDNAEDAAFASIGSARARTWSSPPTG